MTQAPFLAVFMTGNAAMYTALVALGALLGGALIRRDSSHWPIPPWQRWGLIAIVLAGGIFGAALPASWAGGAIQEHAARCVIQPKTILMGLLFGFFGAAVFKKSLRITAETSDGFARGTPLMMAVGRLGCAAGHCCVGRAVDGPWGWDLGDGVPRLPVQLIEAALLLALAAVMEALHRRGLWRDRRLFAFFIFYGLIRFGLEFLREPIAGAPLGLGFYQWLALLLAAVGAWQFLKRGRPLPTGDFRNPLRAFPSPLGGGCGRGEVFSREEGT